EPVVVGSPLIEQEIPSVRTDPIIFKLPIRDGEYFLVANRQRDGYDRGLPGSGLLIWHIDEDVPDNSNDAHRMVDLEEADEKSGDHPLDSTDPWFSSTEGFLPTSVPNSNAYGNVRTGWRVKNIGPSGQTMTADISKQVLDDVAVVSIDTDRFVNEGDSIEIVVNVTNRGAKAREDLPVNLTVFYQEYREENLVFWKEVTVPTLETEEYKRLSFRFRPTFSGRYIVEALAILREDEIPEDNDRIAHFNSNELYFWDDVEEGNLSWSTNTSRGRYRWDIIDDYPKGSYSPTHSWHFGKFEGELSSINKTEFTLTSGSIHIPSGSEAHIVFHHKYIFERLVEVGGRVPGDRPSDKGRLEVSVNGSNWTQVMGWGENPEETVQFDWLMVSVNITNLLQPGGTDLRLRFKVTSDGQPMGAGWWLDNIGVVRDEPQYGILLKAYEQEKTVEPGSMATFLLKIVNVGDFEGDFYITARNLPDHWEYAISENASKVGYDALRVELRIDEAALAYLKIQPPSSAERGSKNNVTAVAKSLADDSVIQEVNVTVLIATALFDISLEEFMLLVILLFILILPIAFVVDYLRRTKKVL
ncbi:MAG: hypothetical protein ACE5KV_07600, partial [Thermoplasmata archaeon]